MSCPRTQHNVPGQGLNWTARSGDERTKHEATPRLPCRIVLIIYSSLYLKVQELGGVPLMTKASDMSYTIPDEKVSIKALCIFCQRFLTSGRLSVHSFVTLTQGAFCSFQVVITYVAYLCARLLDLREETKAARCIQMVWRRHRLKKQLERKKVRQIQKLCL